MYHLNGKVGTKQTPHLDISSSEMIAQCPIILMENWREIIKKEVRKALNQARTGKVVGLNEVNVELLKLINIDGNNILLKLFNNIYTTENIFANWLRSTFISLSKNFECETMQWL